MGFNTSMIVLNDAAHIIKDDKEFGKKVYDAINEVGLYVRPNGDGRIDISSGGHVNAASVIETHHADGISVVAFGGNCGNIISKPLVHGWRFNDGTDEGRVEIVRQLAHKLGYTLRKRSK